jgi:hypothetical protein
VPAVPSCLLEPLWDQFAALPPAREGYAEGHPLGCHRRRVPDRVVFDHIVRRWSTAPATSGSPAQAARTAPSDAASNNGLNSGYLSWLTLWRLRRTTA